MPHFILKWRGGALADKGAADEKLTRIWLVGPFENERASCKWARRDQKNDGDDPRWQDVTLEPSNRNIEYISIVAP